MAGLVVGLDRFWQLAGNHDTKVSRKTILIINGGRSINSFLAGKDTVFLYQVRFRAN